MCSEMSVMHWLKATIGTWSSNSGCFVIAIVKALVRKSFKMRKSEDIGASIGSSDGNLGWDSRSAYFGRCSFTQQRGGCK